MYSITPFFSSIIVNRRLSSRVKTVKSVYTDLESEEDTRSVSSDEEEEEGEKGEEEEGNEMAYAVEDSDEEKAVSRIRKDNYVVDSGSDGSQGETSKRASITTQKDKGKYRI